MAISTTFSEQYTSAGLTQTFDATNMPDVILLNPNPSSVILAAPINLSFITGTPVVGTFWRVIILASTETQSYPSGTLFGIPLPSSNVTNFPTLIFNFLVDTSGNIIMETSTRDINLVNSINGNAITTGTLPIGKLKNAIANSILTTDISGVWQVVQTTGDAIIASNGTISIQPGVIVNSEISNTAAIAVNKLAALTPSEVVTTDGSGFIQSSATVSPTLGGLGLNASSSTGIIKFNSGTATIGSISEVIVSDVDFTNPPSGIATNKIKMPFAGIVTDIYAIVFVTIAGTDSATITPKNNSGTSMSLSAPLSFSANSAVDTALDVSVTANNSFIAGDILSFTTSKPTVGGKVKLSITITRTS